MHEAYHARPKKSTVSSAQARNAARSTVTPSENTCGTARQYHEICTVCVGSTHVTQCEYRTWHSGWQDTLRQYRMRRSGCDDTVCQYRAWRSERVGWSGT
eukprot:3304830-Rhodomonas_salina.1